MNNQLDIAIAGGGLAGTLIAYRLRQLLPDLRLAVFERDGRLGGEHTWSFHETDLSPAARDWIAPFVAHRWAGQDVAFPSHSRRLSTPYCSITSAKLHEVAIGVLGDAVRLSAPLKEVTADGVQMEDGSHVSARAVIDCRGDRRSPHIALGFQKFLGQEIRFSEPHGLDAPIIMDATVPQKDGYRFVYVLPFDSQTALVEDTRYADGEALTKSDLRADIDKYVRGRGWTIGSVLREEEGVLPIALGGDIEAYWSDGPQGVARAGMRAALFHPLTGYSLPDAVVMADLIAAQKDFSAPAIHDLTRRHSISVWRGRGYYRLLSRMLFRAARPEMRYKVLERFYKLPQPLIERFYAGVSPLTDRARILAGKPPVPIGRAVKCLSEKSAFRPA